MEYPILKFLNLQYFYCIIYSLFGGECAPVEPLDTSGTTTISGTSGTFNLSTTTPATSTHSADFWSWLFGGSSGGAGQTAAESSGAFGALVDGTTFLTGVFGGTVSFIWGVFSALSYTISGILILLLAGAAIGLFLIRSSEAEKYSTVPPRHKTAGHSRSRWQQLLDRAISTDPKEWRGAILEADVILGELLEKLGYSGALTADRLRAIPEGAFVTLPNAWEAHRIRNFVAARSSDYILTQREAFRIMKLYEQVFEEFDFI